jgi:Amt family ammonium transporter
VFILWLGWFGFNPGSTTAVGGGDFAMIAVTTNLAAAAGCVSAMFTAWVVFGKPDVSFALNGALAGLVGITAGCYNMSAPGAAMVGLLAGILVVGVCGAWGTLAVGLWGISDGAGIGLLNGGGSAQLVTQAIGVGAGFAWSFFVSLGIFLAIKYTMGLRVSEVEEIEGLDVHEHGMAAYPAGWINDMPIGTVTAANYVGRAEAPVAATPKPQRA